MKKFFALLSAAGASAVSFAEGTTLNVSNVTGTDGVLGTVKAYIESVADGAWPIVTAIVAIGILFWLGRAMIRAVRSYFSTSM